MSASENLSNLGIVLPEPPKAVASYFPAVKSGNLIYVSGQIPIENGALKYAGAVSDENLETAKKAAELCAVNVIAQAAALSGGVDNIRRIVKISVFVNAAEGFTGEHMVANGASDLFVSVFGDDGRHARSAVGAVLPMGAMTEVEAIIEV